jgi:hypothetical protein
MIPPVRTSTYPKCPICQDGELGPGLGTGHVAISRCPACAHRVANHLALAPGDAPIDYHARYPEGTCLGAIEATRRRQGRRLLAELRRLVPDLQGLVDIGAGRGWFLEEARTAGVPALAGIDTSAVAVGLLAANGFEAVTTAPPREAAHDSSFARLSFRPNVITLLDVIEHFPPESASQMIRDTVAEAGEELELVVVKVPLSCGLLYRAATVSARLGSTALLDQLYQVGTDPPHLSYFSPRSLETLLERCGLRVVLKLGDRDFEPKWLRSRVQALRRLPAFLPASLGWIMAAGIRVTGGHDAAIFFAATPRWGGIAARTTR